MKKVSKAILVGFAALVALGVALIAGLNLYVQSPGSQTRIQEELSKLLRLPLKLTNVTVSPFGSLKITGITIPNGGANFLEAASFNARYRLLPLLQGKLVITEMSVESPKILWGQSPDGKWKLPEPEQAARIAKENPPKSEEKKPAEERKKSSFAVIVGRFDVKGGAVDLLDKDKKHVAALSNVNMTYTSLTTELIEGTATIGKLVWADTLVLENVKTPFSYADGAFNLPEITAALAGGTLQGKFHTHSEQARSPFKIAVGLNKVDLDRLATETGAEAGKTVGLLSGQIEVHGDLQDSDRRDGQGRLDLRDGQFQQLELLQKIGQILGLRELSDMRVRDGHADFQLSGDKVAISKITLNTSDLQLTAQGTAHLNKHLNLTAQLSADDALVQKLPGGIGESFTPIDGGRRAIDFTVTGTVDKPKTDLLDKLIGQKINVQMGGLLHSIFGGGKKSDDEKAKNDDQKPEKEHKKKDKPAEQNPAPSPAASPSPGVLSTPAPATPQPQPAAPNP